jgi:hypothetical protein
MKIPDTQLVADTYDKLTALEAKSGPEILTDITQPVVVICRSLEILAEGGFRNFFERGLPLQATAEAYRRIGATTIATVLRDLLELFPEADVPTDYDQRMEIVNGLYRLHSERIQHLEATYESASDMIVHQLAAWIRAHSYLFQ